MRDRAGQCVPVHRGGTLPQGLDDDERLLKAIVGIEIVIERLDGKNKAG